MKTLSDSNIIIAFVMFNMASGAVLVYLTDTHYPGARLARLVRLVVAVHIALTLILAIILNARS